MIQYMSLYNILAYAERAICYRPTPVRLSVRYTGGSVETVEVRIMQFSPYRHSSPIPLLFAVGL